MLVGGSMSHPGTASVTDMGERLREALDNHRFAFYFQPIVDLSNGEVRQQEVLLRLIDGDRHIGPEEFLPVAEWLGLATEIDRMVVCDAIAMLEAGTAQVLDVNITGPSFGDRDLFTLIETELERTSVDPSRLVIEVTETEAIADMERAIDFAEALHLLGCRLALDDFGVGFSSLYYVKHLPLEFVKLDGEFVRDLSTSERDRAMVEGMVGLARGLELITVAEFVSDQKTVELLREIGVDCGQGFYLGEPTLAPGLRTDGASPRTNSNHSNSASRPASSAGSSAST